MIKTTLKSTPVALLFVAVASTAIAEQCEDPDTLTFSITPSEDAADEFKRYQPVIQHLSETTGKEIAFYAPACVSQEP